MTQVSRRGILILYSMMIKVGFVMILYAKFQVWYKALPPLFGISINSISRGHQLYELCLIWHSISLKHCVCVSESYISKQFSTQWLKEREKYRRSKCIVVSPLSNCLAYYHIPYTAVARPIKRQPLIIYQCAKSRKHKTKLYILMNKNKTNISFTLWKKGRKNTLLPYEASDERPSPVRQWERQSHSQFMVASQMKTAKSRKRLSSHKLDSMPSDPLLPASNQKVTCIHTSKASSAFPLCIIMASLLIPWRFAK